MRSYDIIIIGAGASGVFMSYELAKLNVDADILMIDRGGTAGKEALPHKSRSEKLPQMFPVSYHERIWRSGNSF